MDEVGSDGLQVDEHIVELLQDEEATGHALTTWDGITLRWGSANHLEEVLSDSEVVLLVLFFSDQAMDDGLEDVFFWENTLHVFDKLVGLVHFFVLEVVDDQI